MDTDIILDNTEYDQKALECILSKYIMKMYKGFKGIRDDNEQIKNIYYDPEDNKYLYKVNPKSTDTMSYRDSLKSYLNNEIHLEDTPEIPFNSLGKDGHIETIVIGDIPITICFTRSAGFIKTKKSTSPKETLIDLSEVINEKAEQTKEFYRRRCIDITKNEGKNVFTGEFGPGHTKTIEDSADKLFNDEEE